MNEIEKFSKMGIKRIIGVASGKGGVGKSTTTVLLARALASRGNKVAILDADITGPSIPRLLGVEGIAGESDGEKLIPVSDPQGIKLISINMFLKDEDDPVVWRGPLLSGALRQFYQEADWGDIDYLIVDFPPGTADVVLTGLQQLPLDGLVVVATPQDFVSMIVSKSVKMAVKMNTPVLGLVENMGAMVCPHCSKEFRLFAQGAANDGANKLGLPLLARFAWRQELAQAGALDWEKLPNDLRATAEGLALEVHTAMAPRT
ncbi:Mrp/NBP35 family ATP-binding protein [Treponema sp.]